MGGLYQQVRKLREAVDDLAEAWAADGRVDSLVDSVASATASLDHLATKVEAINHTARHAANSAGCADASAKQLHRRMTELSETVAERIDMVEEKARNDRIAIRQALDDMADRLGVLKTPPGKSPRRKGKP